MYNSQGASTPRAPDHMEACADTIYRIPGYWAVWLQYAGKLLEATDGLLAQTSF